MTLSSDIGVNNGVMNTVIPFVFVCMKLFSLSIRLNISDMYWLMFIVARGDCRDIKIMPKLFTIFGFARKQDLNASNAPY